MEKRGERKHENSKGKGKRVERGVEKEEITRYEKREKKEVEKDEQWRREGKR